MIRLRRRDFLARCLSAAALATGCARGSANPTPPASSSGGNFAPQPGYGGKGAAAWDQPFTVANGSNPFGAPGPTLALFDDFRNGTPGQTMTNGAVPVASAVGATWQTLDFVPPKWTAGANRSGGNSCRILDNERAGNGGVFGRRINIPFKADYTAVYFFYAEHWHGWDGGNDEGGGGGYYKHNWLQHNNTYGGGFNIVIPVFAQYDDRKPSSAIYTAFGGNDSANPGATNADQPFRSWIIANRANGIGKWDTNGWNSLECAYVGDPVNPTGASGYQYMGLYNTPNKRAINASISSGPWNDGSTNRKYTEPYPLFLSGNAGHGPKLPYDRMNGMQLVGLMQNVGTHTVDRADVYVAVGPNCMKRFFIADANTLARCTTIMPCTIDSWSAGAVTIRPRQGAFTTIAGTYLYWSDPRNNISLAGQFVAPGTGTG